MPVLAEWLEQFNERMGREGVPHFGRPLKAWFEWCRETGETLEIGDQKAQEIFAWFEGRSPDGSLYIPSAFTGVFYYDAYFWPVEIPKVLGSAVLEGRNALPAMPHVTKEKLFASADDLENFKATWADCLDYGNGFRAVNPFHVVAEFWQRLLASGDRKLRSAVEDLKERPGENAMQSSREACEMFLKAALARDYGLTEEDAKNPRKYGHDLSKLLGAMVQNKPTKIFAEVQNRLKMFPSVEDRYAAKAYTNAELWEAHKTAQSVASEVVRMLTGFVYNTRSRLATRF